MDLPLQNFVSLPVIVTNYISRSFRCAITRVSTISFNDLKVFDIKTRAFLSMLIYPKYMSKFTYQSIYSRVYTKNTYLHFDKLLTDCYRALFIS